MRETAKLFDYRCENGHFNKYLHGKGIDIGGGPDCLVLPEEIQGDVRLWDLRDGDAQYVHDFDEETFDFVYSSHCLEHMRDIDIALMNWIRICKVDGYIYITIPHEKYYEKSHWPSLFNSDHKHSFTLDEKTDLPENVVVCDWIKKFDDWIDVVEIKENLRNYDFTKDSQIDQTSNYYDKISAQIDIILKKKKRVSDDINWSKNNENNYQTDYKNYFIPMMNGYDESVKKKLEPIISRKNSHPVLKDCREVYVYGVGNIGIELQHYLENNGISVLGFVVSDMEINPKVFKGIKVEKINDSYKDKPILIGIGERARGEVSSLLTEQGFKLFV